MKSLFVATLMASTAWAGEYAVFVSGARMHIDRHQEEEGKLRLFNGPGYIEVPVGTVVSFELEPAAPVKPAPEAAPEPTPPPADYRQMVDRAADKYGLPKEFVRSVVKAESGFQPHAVSPKGAVGLMQLMPATAKTLGADPHDPVQNVDAGTRYLRELLLKYDGAVWHALAAYNAGIGAVEKHRGIPPYAETRSYIRRIDRDYKAATGSDR